MPSWTCAIARGLTNVAVPTCTAAQPAIRKDRKSTRLNSSHRGISYAVCRFAASLPTLRSSDLAWLWILKAGAALSVFWQVPGQLHQRPQAVRHEVGGDAVVDLRDRARIDERGSPDLHRGAARNQKRSEERRVGKECGTGRTAAQ